jgi:hypothetical protein
LVNEKKYPKKPTRRKTITNPSKISRTHKPENLELEEWQRLLREIYGQKQDFKLNNLGDHPIFSDFLVTDAETDRIYKVAIRGAEAGMNYCSCPDYSINHPGTCKHIAFTLAQLMKKRGAKKGLSKGIYPDLFRNFPSLWSETGGPFQGRQGCSPPSISLGQTTFRR